MDAVEKSIESPMDQQGLKERPFFFSNGDYRLFGVMHRPVGDSVKGAIVFCHPYGEEKLWSQRVYVNFARQLASAGYAVLRFDFMGYGDSEGYFSDSNIETHLSDIRCAISTISGEFQQCKNVTLVGLRMGATLAALVAENSKDIDRIVLWDPTIDMKKFMQMALRANLTAQMAAHKKIVLNREQMVEKMKSGETLNLEGYELSYNYYEQACELNLNKNKKEFPGKCLIVQVGREGQPIHKELEMLKSLYKDAEARHVVEEQFWKEIKNFCEKAERLSAVTLDWLES